MANQLTVQFPVLSATMWEIDFDVVPSGTLVNNHYSGVALEAVPLKNPNPGANFGGVFASNVYDPAMADTPPNVVTFIKPPQPAPINELGGGIKVTFASPQSYVSIDARPIVSSVNFRPMVRPYLDVYGWPIQLLHNKQIVPHLATVYFPLAPDDPNFEKWLAMEYLSTTPNIGSVVFSCGHSDQEVGASVTALFDRLRFSAHVPIAATHFLG
jgi:hypothetical protein